MLVWNINQNNIIGKKMKQLKFYLLSSFIALLLFVVGCGDNDLDEPNLVETGSISGTVTFSGTRPDSGSVLMTLDTQYPPTGPPASSKTIENDELVDNVYEYSFMGLSFGEYAALTVTYWPNGYSSGSTDYNLLGSYLDTMTLSIDIPQLNIGINADF
tara:strand:+ start:1723 stop:2196 length:474 start_codon:yes stop_codon:yes gene_type:complete